LENCLALSTGDKRQALRDMLAFISENNILHLKDFADHNPEVKLKNNPENKNDRPSY